MRKSFMIDSRRLTLRLMRLIMRSVGTLNSSKIGRQRRGSLLLTNYVFDGERVDVEWSKARSYKLASLNPAGKVNCRHISVYDYADHKKLLKTLASLKTWRPSELRAA